MALHPTDFAILLGQLMIVVAAYGAFYISAFVAFIAILGSLLVTLKRHPKGTVTGIVICFGGVFTCVVHAVLSCNRMDVGYAELKKDADYLAAAAGAHLPGDPVIILRCIADCERVFAYGALIFWILLTAIWLVSRLRQRQLPRVGPAI